MPENANDPSLKSWIKVDENSDFPIQNIPFGIFQKEGGEPQAGTIIGDQIIDLNQLQMRGYFQDLNLPEGIFDQRYLNDFIALGKASTNALRERVSMIFRDDNDELRSNESAREKVLIYTSEVNMLMPIEVKNYSDFYSSKEHATNVGSMFRDPDKALLPNWSHMPIAYHGRASSIMVSGVDVLRPKGQLKFPDQENPQFGPTQKLDFELELAFVTNQDTDIGSSIATDEAEAFIFGFVLFNDWSARDIQVWEYVPLGPFLGKNFASTISPWIVTLEALASFRTEGPKQEPEVLPYLQYQGDRNFDLALEVGIKPHQEVETTVCRTNFKHMYWNICQQLAHHTVNGCNLAVGDLYASGTISGKEKGAFGSMLELTMNGKEPVLLENGAERSFLEDGDTVIMRGYGIRNGIRVGFGELRNQVLPAV